MPPPNPFEPPRTETAHATESGTGRGRWGRLLVRWVLLIGGLFLLRSPERVVPNPAHDAQIVVRGIGGLMALLAVVPLGRPRRNRATTRAAEGEVDVEDL